MSMTTALIYDLTELAADLSGYDAEDLIADQTFLELGFDSLFLTQLATAVSNQFGTQVTFRSLFSDHPSIARLAQFLEPNLDGETRAKYAHRNATAADDQTASLATPAELTTLPTPTAAPEQSTPVIQPSIAQPTPVRAPSSGLQSLLAEQLALMTQQLELLGAGSSASATVQSAPPSTIAEPSVPAPSTQLSTERSSSDQPTDEPIELPAGFGPGTVSSETAEITAEQQAHLDRLIQDYTARTAGSKESTQQYRQWHADPRTASGFNPLWKEMVYPVVVNQSKGCRLWDTDGNEYIDLLNGFGPNFLGHSPEFITDALIDQLRSGVEIGPQTPLAGETAKMICEFSGMDRATFVNTGSEAVQAAMRIARTCTGRDKIVAFSGDYHGNFDEVLIRAGGPAGKRKTVPLAPGIPRASVSNMEVLDYGADSALRRIEAIASDVAAVVVEPIQSRRPELQPREFLHRLRALTEQHGIVLVFDEVITGFRSQPGGAQAFYDVKADLVTYGKIVGGGMPIGVVAGRQSLMDTFDGGHWQYGDNSFPEAGVTFFAGTFIRHPLTIKATHETVKYLLKHGAEVYERVNRNADWLCQRINNLFTAYGIDIEVPHCNSQIFVRVNEPHPLAGLLFYHLRLRGIYLQEGFPCYLTDAHEQHDLEAIVDAFTQATEQLVALGVFGDVSHLPDTAIDDSSVFPITDSQMEIWFDSVASESAACAYNESDTLKLSGPLDVERLKRSLHTVVDRHDAFRLRFDDHGQWLAPDAQFDLQHTDLRQAEAGRWAEIRTGFGQQSFDLQQGPVCRAHLVTLADKEHYLVFAAHHLVYDGWSADVLLHELSVAYNSQGNPPSNAAQSFRTFVLAQTSESAQSLRRESSRYWLERLQQTLPEPLQLPNDHSRPAIWDHNGDTASHMIDPGLSQQLEQCAASQGVTMYALTLAAYRVLLARLSGQQQFAIGTSVSSQPIVGFPDMIGLGLNFIPVPVQLHDEATITTLLDSAMSDVLTVAEHPHTTLATLLQDLDLPRDLSRPLLAQTVFNYAPKSSRIEFEGLTSEREENPRSYVHSELFANITQTDRGLQLDWDFATALFDCKTVERWMECYENILRQFVVDPSLTMAQIDLPTEAQSRQLATFSRGPDLVIPDCWVHDLVQRNGKPSANIAVSDEHNELNYAELQQHSLALRSQLWAQGAKPGDRIGIVAERSVLLPIAVLGILAAGCTYLPLDPTHPQQRLIDIMEQAKPTLVVRLGDAGPMLSDATPELSFSLDTPVATEAPQFELPPASELGHHLLFTSGSTGRPKGVLVRHREVINFLLSMAQTPGIKPSDRLVAATTLTFDISILELLLPLTVGASVHIASEQDVNEPAMLAQLVTARDANVFQATPSGYRALLDDGWQPTDGMLLLCGGEALDAELADRLLQHRVDLWNMYGPTETTVWSSCGRITDANQISIGTPIANTVIQVVDERDRRVPVGVAGELVIGGLGLAQGYLDRPNLTAIRFAECDGHRWYRTGDRARWRADGQLEHLGRNDDQVKVRGFRIELGEIESALNSAPAIQGAAVRLIELAPGDQRLVAYCVNSDRRLSTIKLRKALRLVLPDYMIPQHFVSLDAMPLNSSGKVDRNRLPLPTEVVEQQRGQTPLSGDAEHKIGAIWQGLIGVSSIDAHDNFFDLGGHSLLAVKAVQAMHDAFGQRVPPQTLVMSNLRELAKQFSTATDVSQAS